METQKIVFILNAYLSVSSVMFCKQCLAYTVLIDPCYHAIHNINLGFKLNYISVNYLQIYVSTSLRQLNLHSLIQYWGCISPSSLQVIIFLN